MSLRWGLAAPAKVYVAPLADCLARSRSLSFGIGAEEIDGLDMAPGLIVCAVDGGAGAELHDRQSHDQPGCGQCNSAFRASRKGRRSASRFLSHFWPASCGDGELGGRRRRRPITWRSRKQAPELPVADPGRDVRQDVNISAHWTIDRLQNDLLNEFTSRRWEGPSPSPADRDA